MRLKGKMTKAKVALVVFMVSVISIAAVGPTERYFEIAKNLDIFATLFKEVNAYYVDEVDPDKLIRTGIDAMLLSLDPYTNYIPEDEIESFRTMTTGQYAGIGALIGKIEDEIVITMPYEGFAADRAGLKIGDELVEINGVEVKGKSISDISSLLKGPVRTEVTIKVKRFGEDEAQAFSFKREKITVTNVPYYGIVGSEVGYIMLEDFTTNAGKEVEEAVKKLKDDGAKSIILDLRNNPGGLLSEAVNVSNVFIPKNKEVVSTKGKVEEWNKEYKTLNSPTDTKIPLVVLANGGSASASEIVSGVIQDYDRGILMGQQTFGKGLVQTTRPLTYNSQLKVTTAKYYIPSGRCIQALDYSHRKQDGSVGQVADSLKGEYKTQNGRKVYDGEGLSPDLEIEPQYLATITATLISEGLIFKYATQYAATHNSPASLGEVKISDSDYQDFRTWLEDHPFTYTTKVENDLKQLTEAAKKEKYYEDIKPQLADLEKKMMHNKEADLTRFKDEISEVLREEIASRYFLQSGGIRAALKNDPLINKAVGVLENETAYNKILNSN